MNNDHDSYWHVTFEQLLDYLERRLGPVEVEQVEAHLSTECALCQMDFTWLQETLGLMASDAWVEPPVESRTAVRQMYRDHQNQRNSTLTFGEWLGQLLAPRRPLLVAAGALILIIAIGMIARLPFGPSNSSETAQVGEIRGTVEVQLAGNESWLPAPEHESIDSGDQIRTGNESGAVLTFPDDSKTFIAPETELSILRMTTTPDNSRQVIVLRQNTGQTFHIVQPLPSAGSRFEVQTPSAIVVVRGTQFAVEVDSAGATTVTVDEGVVDVIAQGTTVVLEAGETMTVNPNGGPDVAGPALKRTAPAQLATAVPARAEGTRTSESGAEVPAISDSPTSTRTPTRTKTPTPFPTPSPTQLPPSPTSTSTNTPTPVHENNPTNTPKPSNTDSPTQESPPTEPPPTEPPPTEVVKPTDSPPDSPTHQPPGQTKTPQPPGQTRNPK